MMIPDNKAQPVYTWPEIAGRFTGSDILLGNGFSLRFTDSFDYESLFREFLDRLEPDQRTAFEALSSTNFELLLESFGQAIRVNEAFGMPHDPLVEARNALRQGLIEAIHQIHPHYADLDAEQLLRISIALDPFDDIFTVNYDTILYHIIMLAIDRHEEDPAVRPYSDYFWQELDNNFLQFMNYQDYEKYKLIYYLHGALFLFRERHYDVKIRRNDETELIDRIGELIGQGTTPLFVSEGAPDEKLFAISRSEYLGFTHGHLREHRKSLVIYGTSLSAPDAHIAKAIRKSTDEAAVSLHIANKDQEDIHESMKRYQEILNGVKLTFFDADTLF